MQLAAPAESLLFAEFATGTTGGGSEGGGAGVATSLFLHGGLTNGVLLRCAVDKVGGQLSDTRTRFLGSRPPRLYATVVRGARALLALSSRPWLGYNDMGRYALQPLAYEALDHAAPFVSEQCPEGLVAVAGGTLRILATERLGEPFHQRVAKLRYTPRRMVVHPALKVVIIAEADHNSAPAAPGWPSP